MDLIKFYQFIYRLKYRYIIWFDFGQTSNIVRSESQYANNNNRAPIKQSADPINPFISRYDDPS